MLKVLKGCNALLKCMIFLLTASLFLISMYILWDNRQIYTAAENVRADLYALKPEGDEEIKDNFASLKKINPDVVAWLTVDGTNIDYPVVQGKTNMTYMDKDVYGRFSLAGSIFLDSRNDRQFRDHYSIIYGHHMENHLMFGDLDLYKDKEFFEANHTASITTEIAKTPYQVLAIDEMPDSVHQIFDPTVWNNDLTGLSDFIEKYSLHTHDGLMQQLKNSPTKFRVVALVTCSTGSTGMRTVLFLVTPCAEDDPGTSPTEPQNPSDNDPNNKPDDNPNDNPNNKPPHTDAGIWYSRLAWVSLLLSTICMSALIFIKRRQNPKGHKSEDSAKS